MEGAEEQDRRRSAASWVIVIILILVVGWVATGSDGGDFGPPVPTSPPADVPEQLVLDISARLEGPSSEDLTVEVVDQHIGPSTDRTGDAVLRRYMLLVRNRSGRLLYLPEEAVLPVTFTPGAEVGVWTINDQTGFGVALGGAQTRTVVAADDPRVIGLEVAADELHPDVPTAIAMWVAVPQLTGPGQHLSLDVPFGGSTIVVSATVSVAPFDPRALPPQPIRGVAGEELPIPDLGAALPALIGNAHPVWIANTEEHGITVVDARAPQSVTGVVPLVRWCPSTNGFMAEDWNRFDAAGNAVEPTTSDGLATYTGRHVGDAFLLDGGRPGTARESTSIQRAHDGYEFAEDGMSTGTWMTCRTVDLPPTVNPDEGPSVPFDTSLLPEAPLSIVPAITSTTLVDGTVILGRDGRGQICAGESDDLVACSDGQSVDVVVGEVWPQEVEGQIAFAGPFIIGGMSDGLITDLWSPQPLRPRLDPQQPTLMAVGLWREFISPEDRANVCQNEVGTCFGRASFTDLQILTHDGVPAPLGWNTQLPAGWIGVVQGRAGQAPEWEPRVAVMSGLEQLAAGELVRVGLVDVNGGVTVERIDADEDATPLPQSQDDS